MAKKKHVHKTIGGQYIPFPRMFLTSEAFAALPPYANKLFFDLAAQYNGFNNGDLSLSWKSAAKRHWKSRSTLCIAFNKLLSTGFIIKTRQGGRNKCCLYALTLYSLDDCKGKLDAGFKATNSPIGGWYKDKG